MKRKRKEKKEKVAGAVCWVCDKIYPADIDFGQGFGMASSLFEEGVISFFGSEFDGEIQLFPEFAEKYPDIIFGRSESICDECINRLIEAGELRLVHETFC